MFIIKKIVGILINPINLFFFASIIGWVIIWFRKTKWIGRSILLAATLLVLTTSFPLFVNTFSKPLEWKHEPIDQWITKNTDRLSSVKYVVVLSSGSAFNPKLSATNQLQDVTLIRLVEGIRIYRKLKNAKLIVSGNHPFSAVSHAEIMGKAAIELGVPATDILLEGKSNDTKDQAVQIKNIVQNQLFILVTSAVHMPRSVRLMEKQGLQPIAAPTDYFNRETANYSMFNQIPSASAGSFFERTIHEYIGLLWASLRGQL